MNPSITAATFLLLQKTLLGTHFVTVLLIIFRCRISFDYLRTCKLFFIQRCFQSGGTGRNQEEVQGVDNYVLTGTDVLTVFS